MDRKVLKSLSVTAKFRRVNITWGWASRSLDRWAKPHVVQVNEEGRVVDLVLMFDAISGKGRLLPVHAEAGLCVKELLT